MSQNHEICRSSSSGSIRKAPAQKYATDTNRYEKEQTPIIDIEALKTIARLVRSIKAKIESESRILK
jgi:hypothetical protein